jgi:hypothetical protein
MWTDRGFPLDENERIGVPVSDLVAHSRERNEKLDMPYLELWIAILDEHISWFISLVCVIRAGQERHGQFTNFEKSILFILHKIIGDSTAIRHLISLGFDAAAQALLRSVCEYMEVMVAILHRPSLANEFVKSDTPESAQEFWNAQLKGGKIRRKMSAAWSEFFPEQDSDAAEWFTNWGRSSYGILSGVTHPSYAGGLMATFTLKTRHVEENWLGIWGDRSDGSVNTIYIYLQFVFPILLLGRDFPFDGFDEYLSKKPTYDKADEFHRHVRMGRDILASLILSLGKDSNAPHVFPELDLSFFEKRMP